jgi:hypothetical protein
MQVSRNVYQCNADGRRNRSFCAQVVVVVLSCVQHSKCNLSASFATVDDGDDDSDDVLLLYRVYMSVTVRVRVMADCDKHRH